ncbi:MAG: methylated-DNA--[protein]-cysteine S-methyltransferase [Lachnospiraceae bacterium]|nr:methylated-DNA--[protein]-cysteine S-methyltransferase [Lachnospiraceae bacterium]
MTKEKLSRAVYKSPVGELLIVCTETALLSLGARKEQESAEDKENNPVIQQTIKELEEYFAGSRKVFTVPLDLRGTEFQKKVWEALREIPYGETRSYKEIAEKIGNPKASRAVGMANHRNPIGIVVPCHRVVGANGKLTGYAGGIPMKQALLELEKPM